MSILLRLVIITLILFSISTVYTTIPQEEQFAKNADEGYYFNYANVISDKGIGQFPLLLKHHLSDKRAQLFPHPARVGHVLITALWFKIFPNTFVWLARLSFFCFVLFLAISFYFSNKLFGQKIAYLYTLILSSSPLIMTSGRRVLQDGILNLFWALSIWLFLDFLVNKKKSEFVAFLIIYSIAITIKEASLVLLIFFILFYFINKYKYKQELSNLYLLGIIVIPVLLVGGAYLFLLKGINNNLSLINFILGVHFPQSVTNTYSLFGRGPWYKYIIDYLLLTPIATLLFIGYFFYILLLKRFERKTVYFMLFFLFVFAVFSSLKYTKIVRFVISLDITISLFAVFALYEFFRQRNSDRQIYCCLMGAVFIFFVNYCNFLHLFYYSNIYDPISYWLLIAKKIIPYIR